MSYIIKIKTVLKLVLISILVPESVEIKRKPLKLQRSLSDRVTQEQKPVVFHDTMALRQRKPKSETRIDFTDLERLDGTVTRIRKVSPRPTRPPPPPPPPNTNGEDKQDEDIYEQVNVVETRKITINKEQSKNIEEDDKSQIDEVLVAEPILRKFSDCVSETKSAKLISLNTNIEIQNASSKNSQNDAAYSKYAKYYNESRDNPNGKIAIITNGSPKLITNGNGKVMMNGESGNKKIEQVGKALVENLNEQIALEKLDKCLMDEKYEETLFKENAPPSAPPRKKSNQKVPHINITNGGTKVRYDIFLFTSVPYFYVGTFLKKNYFLGRVACHDIKELMIFSR